MPTPAYLKKGLVMRADHANADEVRALQRDLRALGYLRQGIDGGFGKQTTLAIRSLQYDLLNNTGGSSGGDGAAPVSVVAFNRGRVIDITGVLDQGLAGCMHDMMREENFPKIPRSKDPVAANAQVIRALKESRDLEVPTPFLIAMLRQESNLQHFSVPNAKRKDEDDYLTVGLDRNSKKVNAEVAITSRGYGAGQYTLFHHPPRAAEVQDFMLDPAGNVEKAADEYRSKFDRFVNGPTSDTRADDRMAEAGTGALRECKFARTDPKFMRDCQACLAGLKKVTIKVGDPFFAGSSGRYAISDYYKTESYANVPLRKDVPCDWPYASRRYNGAGVNSYHYQTIVLKNVVEGK
jgi:peptidoglycan hydrolase-like protein with peptidoglycan-binding domain